MSAFASWIRVVSIHGVPRSGTSWLGQIFNSHPAVAYRHQPLFSYRFKDRIGPHSSKEEVLIFLQELYDVTDDDFILDKRDSYGGACAPAEKAEHASFLVMKMVRYHHLIEKLLRDVDRIKIIGLVRNPCAVINSWLQAPKEFRIGWEPMEEWRQAPKKNQGRIEEYNGFEKWKEVASMFLGLQERYPEQFYLIQYEDLVANPVGETNEMLHFVGLDMHNQVLDFVAHSHNHHSKDPYSVFKRPEVKDRWRKELDRRIVAEITRDIGGTRLERFLA